MGILFNVFQKNHMLQQDEEIEEYEVDTFTPQEISMTSDLVRRKREDEIREKYCKSPVKTGKMV